MSAETRQAIERECDALKQLLLDKNAAYGDSAIKPLGIFAGGDALSLIAVRIDDKLSRIRNMGGITARADAAEDTILDLAGYLILARVAAAQDG